MVRTSLELQYRLAAPSCIRESDLEPRKDPQAMGRDPSSNGRHAGLGETGSAQLRLSVPAGPTSVTPVRDALGKLIAQGDPVVLEQVAVLVGALTSGTDRPDAPPSAPFEVDLRAEPARVIVELCDRDFA